MSQVKSAVFVSPNNLGSYRSGQIVDENLALGMLSASIIKAGGHAEMIDARMFNLNPKTVSSEILRAKPNVLGITMISAESTKWVLELTTAVKEEEHQIHICLGGYFPSLQPQKALEIIPTADSVVVGEGEITVVELMNKISKGRNLDGIAGTVYRAGNGKIIFNPRRQLISNLDELPFPNRYANEKTTENLIEASRGCFGRCTFCAIKPHFGAGASLAWRGKSPERIISELKILLKLNPNNRRVRFVDPNFLGSSSPLHRERAIRIAQLIENSLPQVELYAETRASDILGNEQALIALKGAGLKELYIGVESGSQKVLKCMHKGVSPSQIEKALKILENLGINYQYGFMMITPWTEQGDIDTDLEFLKRIGFIQFDKFFHEMDLIPGTESVEQGKAVGKLKEKGTTGYYTYNCPSLVEKVRSLGAYLNCNHKDLLKRVWYLYKDVQVNYQSGIPGSRESMRELSLLFVNAFENSYQKLKNGIDISSIGEDCVSFLERIIAKIDCRISDSARFPRPSNL